MFTLTTVPVTLDEWGGVQVGFDPTFWFQLPTHQSEIFHMLNPSSPFLLILNPQPLNNFVWLK